MRIKVRCTNPECRAVIVADESRAGQTAACPKCRRKLVIRPMAETVAETDTTSDPAEDAAKKDAKGRPGVATKIGRFEIRKRLGSGAFGTVYLTHDPVLNREVALKVPSAAALENPRAKQRFLREPKAAAQLQHPNIVPIFDTGVDGEHHYIASAFIEGETLQQAIERHRPKARRAAELTRDLAIALAYAHSHGIIHRDVKPANIMVDMSGRPMLMDFGLAHLLDSEDKLTRDGAVMGTPAYMAPEQADTARGEVGPASDQYALGTILYHLITGNTPFSGPPSVVLFNVLNQEPTPPRAFEKSIPKDLETICLKAMSKEPASRYASCAALAEDLGRWLADEPIEARPISRVERTARWCRRRPALAATSAVALALLVIVGMVTSRYFKTSDALDQETAGRDAAEASEGEIADQLDMAQTRLREADARLQAALAELDAAKSDLAEAKEAFASATTAADREKAKAQLADAESRLTNADRELRDAETARDKAEKRTEAADVLLESPLALLKSLPDTNGADGAESAEEPLPGLLTQPARLPGIGRWQLETAMPRSEASCVAWSPDGRRVALGMGLGAVRIFDVATLRPIGFFIGHTDRVNAVQWSPDGSRLASAGYDNMVRLWTAEGVPCAVLKGHTDKMRSVAWSPDGQTLASAGFDKTVRLWDADGTPGKILEGHAGTINYVAWSPDGKWLASGGDDRAIRIWASDGSLERAIRGHASRIKSLTWSRDSRRIASSGFDGTVLLFELDGSPVPEPLRLADQVNSIAWSPDGRWLAADDGKWAVRLWRVDGTQRRKLETGIPDTCHHLAWGPGGQSLAAAVGNGFCIWNLQDGGPAVTVRGETAFVSRVAWSPDGKWLAIANSGEGICKLRLWKSDGTGGLALQPDDGNCMDVAWSPDSRRAATANGLQVGRVWGVNGSPGPVLRGHSARLNTVAWSPDGKWLASGDNDKDIRVWSSDIGNVRVLTGHTDAVNSLAWSPDSRQLASAGEDSTVRLWPIDGGRPKVLNMHQEAVRSVAWSPDGMRLASCGEGGMLRLWRADGTPVSVLDTKHSMSGVAWSLGGKRLAIGRYFGEPEIWTIEGKRECVLSGNQAQAIYPSWSPDGRWFGTGGGKYGTVAIWDATSGTLGWLGMIFSDGSSVAFDVTGRFLHGRPSVIESEFVCLVEQPSGRVEVLRPSHFARLISSKAESRGE